MRLLAAGQRPISNVVDASNYVMVELGKPIHTFDAAAVHDGRIIVRRARTGERLVTLDHVERTLDPETLVIADPAGPIGIAGVMGGETSEVGQATTSVVVESAIFDPVNIRRTAFRYALRSEASLRFEKGQEFRMARLGADRTAALIAAWAGGRVAPGAVDSNPVEPAPTTIAFRPDRVNRLLGTAIEPGDQRALLLASASRPPRLRRSPGSPSPPGPSRSGSTPGPAVFEAVLPTWRRDLAVEADIAEEIIRVHGYDLVPSVLPHTPMPAYRHEPLQTRDLVRETLVGAGLSEAVTMALVAPRMVERFPFHDDGALADEPEQCAGGRPITVTNPLSSQHSVLRQSLVGSLLEVVATNLRHGRQDVAIFEVGKGYGATGQPATHEWWRLAFALTGAAEPPAWNRDPELRPRRREGRHRAGLPSPGPRAPAYDGSPTTRTCIPAGPPGCAQAGRWSAGWGSCTPRPSKRSTCAPSGSSSASSRSRDSRRPSRHAQGGLAVATPVGRTRPGGHRQRGPSVCRRAGVDPPPRRAAAPAGRPVRRLPRPAAARVGEEPCLAPHVRR